MIGLDKRKMALLIIALFLAFSVACSGTEDGEKLLRKKHLDQIVDNAQVDGDVTDTLIGLKLDTDYLQSLEIDDYGGWYVGDKKDKKIVANWFSYKEYAFIILSVKGEEKTKRVIVDITIEHIGEKEVDISTGPVLLEGKYRWDIIVIRPPFEGESTKNISGAYVVDTEELQFRDVKDKDPEIFSEV